MKELIRTPRLVLRRWRESDLAPFAEMNADEAVMEHFPKTLDRAGSDAMVARIRAGFANDPFGLWAVEVVGGARFIGFAGLARPRFEASFTPCVEIGWRLAREAWGHGYATEAARAALADGFDRAELDRIYSFTVPKNRRSWRVMEKIGLSKTGEFDHPKLPDGHELRRHVIYEIERTAWLKSQPELRNVDQIDWGSWNPEVKATLLFVRRGDDVLLIEKKRGLGAGKVNGPGGKIDPGETAVEAAKRELFEEVHVRAEGDVEARGTLSFQFTDGLKLHVQVFVAHAHSGSAAETEEAVPLWVPIDEVPYDRMWADDRHWLPQVLRGGRVSARSIFDDDAMLDLVLER